MTTVTNYASAEAFLEGGRSKNDRPIANNTRIHRLDDGRIAARLHETDIVVFEPSGVVELFTGGWLTVTTKARLNEFIGDRGHIWSDRGVWFIGRNWNDKKARFFDGIRVNAFGDVLNPLPAEREEQQAKGEAAMAKRIREYVTGYIKALIEGMPVPSGGDCWDCSMIVSGTGQPLGDTKDDQVHGHLFSHMTERYYVPSLIWNAVKARGFREPSFIMGTRLDHDAFAAGTMRIRNGWGNSEPDRHAIKEFRGELTKYLSKQLIKTRAH